MNYRHAFHAGNFCDVVKHIVLTLILEHLQAKEKPFCVLDTHAGIGSYDLAGDEAVRTDEAAAGILRLLQAKALPPGVGGYLAAVEAFNAARNVGETAGEGLRWYPGSPRLARHFLRAQDRLVLAELHPEDAARLKQEFHGDAQVAVHYQDGYQALKAHLPPQERRGLVLVDPPFEALEEWARIVEGLAEAYKRWPTGIFAIWYPLKDMAAVWRFQTALEETKIPRQLIVELTLSDGRESTRLNGCGLLVVNPPWRLDEDLRRLLPPLQTLLADGASGGSTRVAWLTPAE